ncbi:Fe-S cluster assembly sulfur transfer protein SufU [Ureaplasma canigenitalium]|uniref:Fe-S cluster assembly sulfur transfer protein SufU n=1 Tax=Ureaplasma canigenitalium TaxID=42092 RepID=UPI0004E1D022|nr:SUF system NifU family Fe-S cluster assembly protein [Ureaplasma canigenitalium]
MESFNIDEKLMLRTIIMEHYDRPNFKRKKEDILETDGYIIKNNRTASCIDNVTVYLKTKDGIIVDAFFTGEGCAIATASTDIMIGYILNQSLETALDLFETYSIMISGGEIDKSKLRDLYAFFNVKNHGNRLKCGLIGPRTIKECLLND